METSIEAEWNNLAELHGLGFLGISKLGREPDFPRFKQWVDDGMHAGMHFLENNQHCRENSKYLMPEGKTALHFQSFYDLGDRYHEVMDQEHPEVSQYARTRDYHKRLRKLLEKVVVAGRAQGLIPEKAGTRIFVDSAPVLERAVASRSSHCFVGKNTLLIDPKRGSLFFIASIALDVEISVTSGSQVDPTKRTSEGGCGSCKRCQTFCPTGALDEEYRLDANKCIAYYTIEHREAIPLTYWAYLKLYFFGCDICQLVCPYNRHSKKVVGTQIRVNSKDLNLFDVAMMDASQYELWFAGTPMTRAKISGLKRNAFISMVVAESYEMDRVVQHFQLSELQVLKETAQQYLDAKEQKAWRKNVDISSP